MAWLGVDRQGVKFESYTLEEGFMSFIDSQYAEYRMLTMVGYGVMDCPDDLMTRDNDRRFMVYDLETGDVVAGADYPLDINGVLDFC